MAPPEQGAHGVGDDLLPLVPLDTANSRQRRQRCRVPETSRQTTAGDDRGLPCRVRPCVMILVFVSRRPDFFGKHMQHYILDCSGRQQGAHHFGDGHRAGQAGQREGGGDDPQPCRSESRAWTPFW
jgi:hypothetical protein